METMQARFVPAYSGLEVSIPGGFDYTIDKVAVEVRHVNGMFLDVNSLGCIRFGLVKPKRLIARFGVVVGGLVGGSWRRSVEMTDVPEGWSCDLGCSP